MILLMMGCNDPALASEIESARRLACFYMMDELYLLTHLVRRACEYIE